MVAVVPMRHVVDRPQIRAAAVTDRPQIRAAVVTTRRYVRSPRPISLDGLFLDDFVFFAKCSLAMMGITVGTTTTGYM
jgi:hypothetical protein